MKTLTATDLFCGAGGTSTALARVCERVNRKLRLTAVNHLPVAIETHAANHPGADHLCKTLDAVDPRKAVRGRLDVLVASPECTHHSNARGGMPCNDQSRATAWHVIRWAEALRPSVILVENVREMLGWGPLGANNRPLKSRKGETFAAWIQALRSVGYKVDYRLVNAADFGGATTRTRLFVMAVRGRGPVPWAAPTHEKEPRANLLGSLPRWRAAREVLDLGLPSRSVFNRKVPLKPNTVKRIAEGIRRFWGCDPEPFLVRLRGTGESQVKGSAVSANGPVPTLTGGGEHVGLVEPFITAYHNGAGSERRNHSVHAPLPTADCSNRYGLIEPFLMPTTHHGNGRTRSTNDPLPTVTGANRGGGHVVEPFLVKYNATGTAHPLSEPLDTLSTRDRFGLVTAAGLIADVLFRMLQPSELAAAMGFPSDYVFKGTREQVVKQIGNAVEVHKATAHLYELIHLLAV